MGIVSASCPASEVGKAAMVVEDTLQDNEEVALMVDEHPRASGWAEDWDGDAVHSYKLLLVA